MLSWTVEIGDEWWVKANSSNMSDAVSLLYKWVGGYNQHNGYSDTRWRKTNEYEKTYQFEKYDIPTIRLQFTNGKTMQDLFRKLIKWLSVENDKSINSQIAKLLVILINSDKNQYILKYQSDLIKKLCLIWMKGVCHQSATNVLLQFCRSTDFKLDSDIFRKNIVLCLEHSTISKISALQFIIKSVSHYNPNQMIALFSDNNIVDIISKFAINYQAELRYLAAECMYIAAQIEKNDENNDIKLNEFVHKQYKAINNHKLGKPALKWVDPYNNVIVASDFDKLKWIRNVKVGDIIDFYQQSSWNIGKISAINVINKFTKKFKIDKIVWDKHRNYWSPHTQLTETCYMYVSTAVVMKDTILPFNSKTPFHQYPQICESLNDEIFKCTHCKRPMCHCALIMNISTNINQCRQCIIDSEVNEISKHLQNALQENGYMDINIINMIGSFAIGFIMKCCNKHCEQTVNILNEFDFKNNYDGNGKKICYYKPNEKFNKLKAVNVMKRGRIRIFCSKCTPLTSKCSISDCIVKDTVFDNEQEICENHANCNACKQKYKWEMRKCAICKKLYCSRRDTYCIGKIARNDDDRCTFCHINADKKIIFDAICNSINLENNVIQIICDLAVGITITCSNSNCDGIIDFLSSWDYHEKVINKTNFNKYGYVYYSSRPVRDEKRLSSYKINQTKMSENNAGSSPWPSLATVYLDINDVLKRNVLDTDIIHHIKGEYRRIFCTQCRNSMCLKKCTVNDCDNMDTEHVCLAHPYCTQCKIRRKLSMKCDFCGDDVCINCGIHSKCKVKRYQSERKNLEKLDKKQLKQMCQSKNLSTSGDENDMIERIVAYNESVEILELELKKKKLKEKYLKKLKRKPNKWKR